MKGVQRQLCYANPHGNWHVAVAEETAFESLNKRGIHANGRRRWYEEGRVDG
jgi:hypothetical protein